MTHFPPSTSRDDIPVFSSLDGTRWGVSPRLLLNLSSIVVVAVVLLGTSSLWLPQTQRAWRAAFPAPPYQGPLIFDAMRDGTVQALRADNGSMLWQVSTHQVLGGAQASDRAIDGPHLLFASNTLIFVEGISTAISAFDPRTGKQLWRYPASAGQAIVIAHNEKGMLYCLEFPLSPQYDGSSIATLSALDVKTGVVRWQTHLLDPYEPENFVFADQKVIFSQNSLDSSGNAGGIEALDATTGETLWKKSDRYYSQEKFAADGVIEVSAGGYPEFLSTNDGSLLWTYPIPPYDFSLEDDTITLVGASQDSLYFSIQKNFRDNNSPSTTLQLQAVDPTTGAQRWIIDGSGTLFAFQRIIAVAGTHVLLDAPPESSLSLITTEGLDHDTGNTLWSLSVKQYLQDVIVANGKWLISGDNDLAAYDILSGKLAWQMSTYPTFSHCHLDGATLYCASGTQIFAIDPQTGKQKWLSPKSSDVSYALAS